MTTLTERTNIMGYIDQSIKAGARQSQACQIVDLTERTLQRWRADANLELPKGDRRPARVQVPKNALSPEEKEHILATANSADYAHLPPSQIVPILTDKGIYIASESSFYRVLNSANQLRHRRREAVSQVRSKPRALTATAPNQLYSWDITYLSTTIKGKHYYLYLFLDLYSRHIVGWQVYDCESSEKAGEVMQDICTREQIKPQQVVLHSDNGSPMKGATMLATLQKLGVTPSYSRPSVSNDNPFSEALFKTFKYRHNYPKKGFENLMQARAWVGQFVHWYNHEHRHSAINFVTPAQRHKGEDNTILAKRKAVYEAAKRAHPNRWSGETLNCNPITIVYLNPDQSVKSERKEIIQQKIA